MFVAFLDAKELDTGSTIRGAHWLHLLLLLALVAILQAAANISADQGFVLSTFVRSLYSWLPAIAGISISILGPHRSITRSGLLVALIVTMLMIGLDLSGRVALDAGASAALFRDASVNPMSQASQLGTISWIQTALAWLRGDLTGVGLVNSTYDLGDPRFRAAEAMMEAGMVLLVFATIGFVIAAMSWVRAHVVFKREQDARAFHIFLSWLIAPIVVDLTRSFAAAQHYRVLFGGASLWRPLVPPLVTLALGIFAWWYTARYREPDGA